MRIGRTAQMLNHRHMQVTLYAEYDYSQLMGYLRASNYYSLEKAYEVCQGRDFVPEMVFLLGRMGNSKQALMLIIERLGDVQRVGLSSQDQSNVKTELTGELTSGHRVRSRASR
jgi:hypothetical protein